jgi:hypothetical protein
MPEATRVNRKLFAAARKGDVEGVKAAVAAGADVAAHDGNGWIALHEACRAGRLEAVHALLAAGSDPNAANPDLGFTPLFVATFEKGNSAIVAALLTAGAAPSLATEHGFTALHNAAEQGDLDALEKLLAAGGDASVIAGSRKQTAVDRAAPELRRDLRSLIARYESTPKQSPDEAARIAARTRAPEKAEPFKEARPLLVTRIHVKGNRTRVVERDLDALRKTIKSELPAGYVELVIAHGPGTLAGRARVFGPRTIIRERKKWHARLARYWFWGAGPLLTQADAKRAVLVADTLDGDELVFHPSAPDTLLVLPRESEQVVLASRVGLLAALARLLGRVPAKVTLEPLEDD